MRKLVAGRFFLEKECKPFFGNIQSNDENFRRNTVYCFLLLFLKFNAICNMEFINEFSTLTLGDPANLRLGTELLAAFD